MECATAEKSPASQLPLSSAGPPDEPLLPASSSTNSSQQELFNYLPVFTQEELDFDDLENESISTTDLDFLGLRQRIGEVEQPADDSAGDPQSDEEEEEEDVDSTVPTEVINASEDLLYEGARITSKEAVVMLYGMVFRHNLTKECTDDLLKFLHCILPQDTKNLPKSNYLLEKALNVDFSTAKKNYYCSICQGPLSSDEENPLCVHCNVRCSLATLNHYDKYFYLLDMRQVITFALETPCNAEEILKTLSNRDLDRDQDDVVRDVIDGHSYKSLGTI